MKILVVENLPPSEDPWWLSQLPPLAGDVNLEIEHLLESGQKRWAVIWKLMRLYPRLQEYDVVITMQDSLTTFFLAGVRRVLPRGRCRHIVQEFITREPSNSLYSKLKYRFLRFALASVDAIHCSARSEHTFYRQTLKLPHTRFRYIPLATNTKFLTWPTSPAAPTIVSAGRTGRDYRTLLIAADNLPVRLQIVADPKSLENLTWSGDVEVFYDIPQPELASLLSAARFVVIPLQNRQISVGQSVILIAMALGKAVITTRLGAIADYVQHGRSGLLVPPEDPAALREAMQQLLEQPDRARQLGDAARQRVAARFVPAVSAARICASARSLLLSRPA